MIRPCHPRAFGMRRSKQRGSGVLNPGFRIALRLYGMTRLFLSLRAKSRSVSPAATPGVCLGMPGNLEFVMPVKTGIQTLHASRHRTSFNNTGFLRIKYGAGSPSRFACTE
ncbi:MAG: hypothetical protein JW914_04830 [Syntrophaceae bacterium]|nr:hypothetical protein [Syntrophaceae bacterium]